MPSPSGRLGSRATALTLCGARAARVVRDRGLRSSPRPRAPGRARPRRMAPGGDDDRRGRARGAARRRCRGRRPVRRARRGDRHHAQHDGHRRGGSRSRDLRHEDHRDAVLREPGLPDRRTRAGRARHRRRARSPSASGSSRAGGPCSRMRWTGCGSRGDRWPPAGLALYIIVQLFERPIDGIPWQPRNFIEETARVPLGDLLLRGPRGPTIVKRAAPLHRFFPSGRLSGRGKEAAWRGRRSRPTKSRSLTI